MYPLQNVELQFIVGTRSDGGILFVFDEGFCKVIEGIGIVVGHVVSLDCSTL